MPRYISTILLIIVFASCKSKSQERIDVSKSLILFKEGSDLLIEGFRSNFTDSLAGQKYYKNAIEKFNAAYKADSTNLHLCVYLDDLHYYIQQFDSALYWAFRLSSIDSSKSDDNFSYSQKYSFIGRCYLYEGDLKKSSMYFQKAFDADTRHADNFLQSIADIADQFYFKTIPNQINKLKGVDPCKYSLQVMRWGLDIGKKQPIARELLFTSTKISKREKTCGQ
jgi:tetratricopeptide (TPR) repeat protein